MIPVKHSHLKSVGSNFLESEGRGLGSESQLKVKGRGPDFIVVQKTEVRHPMDEREKTLLVEVPGTTDYV